MCGDLGVSVELFLFAADVPGIHLLTGKEGPWESGRIKADSLPHWEIERGLRELGMADKVILIHSTDVTEPGAAWPSAPGPQYTSWRPNSATVTLTYGALIQPPTEYVLDAWPDAQPITVALADAIDRPPSFEPTKMPAPRYGDVIFHLLRTLSGLMDTDDDNANRAGPLWIGHLKEFKPKFVRMYHRPDDLVIQA